MRYLYTFKQSPLKTSPQLRSVTPTNIQSYLIWLIVMVGFLVCNTSQAGAQTNKKILSQNVIKPLRLARSNIVNNSHKENRPTPAELQELIVKFIHAYENGDTASFEKLFYIHAKSNDHENISGIMYDYILLFNSSTERQLFIKSIKWVIHNNLAKGVGELHALVISHNEQINVIKGKIQFVAEKRNNSLLITQMYHYNLEYSSSN